MSKTSSSACLGYACPKFDSAAKGMSADPEFTNVPNHTIQSALGRACSGVDYCAGQTTTRACVVTGEYVEHLSEGDK